MNESLGACVRDRAVLLRSIRKLLDSRGFLEVTPPCLMSEAIIDVYIDPLGLQQERLGTRYLQTSPELAMKRLLCDGAPSIYAICPAFRANESGQHHNTEFTLLEWYELGGTSRSAIDLLQRLTVEMLQRAPCEVLTYQDAFADGLGVDPLACDITVLRDLVSQEQPSLSQGLITQRDDLLDVLLATRLQTEWSEKKRSVILTRYPISQAALAKPCADDPRCAERFEWFVDGIELANGYDELVDAERLRSRFQSNAERRTLEGRDDLPMPARFLAAIEKGLPPCSGVAVGVDRLLMVQRNQDRLSDVMPLTDDAV
ncbi:MAG: EF-P lysine aminoacylase EpmA [Planctomycetota bacterium]